MIEERSVYHHALVSLEALSAHAIHAGSATHTHDVCLLRDANELPALSATSIAGVLRHLYSQRYGAEATDYLFGFADGEAGQPSWVQFGWGLVHDAHNKPVEGIRPSLDDEILQLLGQRHPLVRQRVRLNSRGAAAEAGKFDVTLVPAGVRYSTVIGFWSDGSAESEALWQQLLRLLVSPAFRIGHGTRNGGGAFGVQALHTERYDLQTRDGQQAYRQRPRSRVAMRTLPQQTLAGDQSADVITLQIPLRAEGGWRVGGGDYPLGLASDRQPDRLPQSEVVIEWTAEQMGQIGERRALLPASAVKGAISHRLDYHYRCLTADWRAEVDQDNERSPASIALFGEAGDSKSSQAGQAGAILLDDVYLSDSQIYTQTHNRIDRFTGGVINGALFEEALLWRTPLTLSLTLLSGQAAEVPAVVRQALARTLDDLASGWLSVGAGGSRGQGAFVANGECLWSDGGVWLQADSAEEICI